MTVSDNVAGALASKVAYSASGMVTILGLQLEVAAWLVGIALALLTLLSNIWFKNKRLKLDRERMILEYDHYRILRDRKYEEQAACKECDK